MTLPAEPPIVARPGRRTATRDPASQLVRWPEAAAGGFMTRDRSVRSFQPVATPSRSPAAAARRSVAAPCRLFDPSTSLSLVTQPNPRPRRLRLRSRQPPLAGQYAEEPAARIRDAAAEA